MHSSVINLELLFFLFCHQEYSGEKVIRKCSYFMIASATMKTMHLSKQIRSRDKDQSLGIRLPVMILSSYLEHLLSPSPIPNET